jgi:hypothetical protein
MGLSFSNMAHVGKGLTFGITLSTEFEEVPRWGYDEFWHIFRMGGGRWLIGIEPLELDMKPDSRRVWELTTEDGRNREVIFFLCFTTNLLFHCRFQYGWLAIEDVWSSGELKRGAGEVAIQYGHIFSPSEGESDPGGAVARGSPPLYSQEAPRSTSV